MTLSLKVSGTVSMVNPSIALTSFNRPSLTHLSIFSPLHSGSSPPAMSQNPVQQRQNKLVILHERQFFGSCMAQKFVQVKERHDEPSVITERGKHANQGVTNNTQNK